MYVLNRHVIGALGVACALALATPAFAANDKGNNGNGNGNGNGGNHATSAPEIDASSGLAAIALLVGVFALVGERRRRPISPG